MFHFVAGCSKPTVDKSTAMLMSFSNASQNLSARVLPTVIRLDVSYQKQSLTDQIEAKLGATSKEPQVGSGVIISKDGYAVTNHHVLNGAQNINVTLADGRQVKAELVGTDEATDLGLIKLPLTDLPAAEWGDSAKIYAGALVWSFGTPFGMNRSVSMGVISSPPRAQYSDTPLNNDLYIQTDAVIIQGSSGGPLVDAAGKVIGINAAHLGDQFEGVGFAIPSNVAKDVSKQLKEHGKIDRAWIGVELAGISQDDAILAGRSDTAGAKIRRFTNANTPAESEGLKPGDLIIEMNGIKVSNQSHAMGLIRESKINEPLKILVQRQRESVTITVHPQKNAND